MYVYYLVGEEDPLLRIVILGMNPGVAAEEKRANSVGQAMEDNVLEEHLAAVLILDKNGSNLSKIFWDFKIHFVFHISQIQ